MAGKADLGRATGAQGEAEWAVSGLTGQGVEELRQAVLSRLWQGGAPGAVLLVSERHAEALRRTVEGLARAEAACRVSTLEVVAGELALALGRPWRTSPAPPCPRPCWTRSSSASVLGSD